MAKATKKQIKVKANNGIAVGKMRDGNKIILNNKTDKKEWNWTKIIGLITAVVILVTALIKAIYSVG